MDKPKEVIVASLAARREALALCGVIALIMLLMAGRFSAIHITAGSMGGEIRPLPNHPSFSPHEETITDEPFDDGRPGYEEPFIAVS